MVGEGGLLFCGLQDPNTVAANPGFQGTGTSPPTVGSETLIRWLRTLGSPRSHLEKRTFVTALAGYPDPMAFVGWAVTLAMWVHVTLNAIVCYEPTPDNPIRGELRLIPVVFATVALWVVVAAAL